MFWESSTGLTTKSLTLSGTDYHVTKESTSFLAPAKDVELCQTCLVFVILAKWLTGILLEQIRRQGRAIVS